MIKGNRQEQIYGLKVLSRLINPTNMQLPTAEVIEKAITDRGVSELHKQTIKNLNKMSFQIKPEFIALLKDIKVQIGDMSLD
ncbi:hypothetical protein, partial [Pseudomonas sp. RTB2]|uniref:hypothetical protein n=1 Tax=Pseudomonas sp. RTB2 TaxID=3048632 RepID=UPI002B223885